MYYPSTMYQCTFSWYQGIATLSMAHCISFYGIWSIMSSCPSCYGSPPVTGACLRGMQYSSSFLQIIPSALRSNCTCSFRFLTNTWYLRELGEFSRPGFYRAKGPVHMGSTAQGLPPTTCSLPLFPMVLSLI